MAAILFILDALLTLVVVAFLLRALMPLVRADFRNPLGQAVLRFTDPLVRPLRRVIGPVGRVDTASIVALLLVQFTGAALLRLVAGGGFALPEILIAGLLGLRGAELDCARHLQPGNTPARGTVRTAARTRQADLPTGGGSGPRPALRADRPAGPADPASLRLE
jgi:uncharacterized protein YggT (Ycf19 family)